MAIIKGSLRELMTENTEQLDELFQGSAVESNLRQAVKHLWEADNALKAALKQADQSQHQQIQGFQQSIEKMAFDMDGQITQMMRGQGQQQGQQLKPRHWFQRLGRK